MLVQRKIWRMPIHRYTLISKSSLSTRKSTSNSATRFFGQKPDKDWNEHEEFFKFTCARFIRDEEGEMERRYIKFDMNELARIAAQMVGSNRCVSVVKYPDGMYSKAFLLTMEDGKQVVAKVPNLNAGLAHFTTASEFATMDFVSLLLPSSSNFLFF
jgi:hypothetical protein